MSVSRPARCLFSGTTIPTARPRIQCRSFQTSLKLSERRRPKIASIKAADMGLIDSRKAAKELYKPYTNEEMAVLAKKYTPAQLRAIEAGEEAVRPEDLDRHGVIRTDPGALNYFDDFSNLRSVVDKKSQYNGPIDPNTRLMTEQEMGESFSTYLDELVKGSPQPSKDDPNYAEKLRPNRVDLEQAIYEAPTYMGTFGPLPHSPSAVAPSIPRKFSPSEPSGFKRVETEDETDSRDPDGTYKKLMKQTGLSLNDLFNLNVKILVQHGVVNQTRLGKINSMYVLAIAGNGNGRLGLGQAKGQELENTLALAKSAAIRNMQPIPRYEDRTIYGEVEGKVSAVEVKLFSRPPGFGLRCQHSIFEMARAAGIHDLAARVPRSRNKMNTIKATYAALVGQKIPEDIARGRGKKLVDVRKVYYGGRV